MSAETSTGRTRGVLAGAAYVLCVLFGASVLWLALWVVAPAVGLGWNPVVIDGDSMTPVLRTGDVVLSAPRADGEPYGEGTIITFDDPAIDGRITTHRIREVNADGSYLTSGDGNRSADSTPVPPDDVRGSGRILVPKIGLPVVWWHRGQHVFVGAFLAALVGAYAYTSRYARAFSPGGDLEPGYEGVEDATQRPRLAPRRPTHAGGALAVNTSLDDRPDPRGHDGSRLSR